MSDLREYLAEVVPDAIILEGPEYDEAIVGTTEEGGIAYSYEVLVEVVMKADNVDYTTAVEWLEYNTVHTHYPGGVQPTFIYDIMV